MSWRERGIYEEERERERETDRQREKEREREREREEAKLAQRKKFRQMRHKRRMENM